MSPTASSVVFFIIALVVSSVLMTLLLLQSLNSEHFIKFVLINFFFFTFLVL